MAVTCQHIWHDEDRRHIGSTHLKRNLFLDTKPLSNLIEYMLRNRLLDDDGFLLPVYDRLRDVVQKQKYEVVTSEPVLTEALYFLTQRDKTQQIRKVVSLVKSIKLSVKCCGSESLDETQYIKNLSYLYVSIMNCEVEEIGKGIGSIIISSDQILVDTTNSPLQGGTAYTLFNLLQYPELI